MNALKEELLEILQKPGSSEASLREELKDLLGEPPPREKMSYEEFLEWADEDKLAEWVNGEIIMHSPASIIHQDMLGFLYEVMRRYTHLRELGKIIPAPFQMKLSSSGREPDILFVSRKRLKQLRKAYLNGPADLAVEIVSPESAGRDRGEKFYEYEQAGVPEYWIIDPQKKRAEFYLLDEEGSYQPALSGKKESSTAGVCRGSG